MTSIDLIVVLQTLVQFLHMFGAFFETSLSVRWRFIGFSMCTISVPINAYICYQAELWVYMATAPIWLVINGIGTYNNGKEYYRQRRNL